MSNAESTTEQKRPSTELADDDLKSFELRFEKNSLTALKDPECPTHLVTLGCDDANIMARLAAVEHPRVPLESAWGAFLLADSDLRRLSRTLHFGGIEYWKEDSPRSTPWGWPSRHFMPNHGVVRYSTRIIMVVGEAMDQYSWEQVAPLLDSSILPNHKEFALTPFLPELSQSQNVDLRAAAAKHRMATAETRTRLATDSNARVRAALATNPEVTATVLNQLSSDPESRVRQAATQGLLETL